MIGTSVMKELILCTLNIVGNILEEELFQKYSPILKKELNTNKSAKVFYQSYDKDAESVTFLLIMTSLMIRVHQKVYVVYSICTFIILFYQQTIRKIHLKRKLFWILLWQINNSETFLRIKFQNLLTPFN